MVPDLSAAPLAADLPARLAAAAPRVLVLGDTVLDQWLTGPSRRLSREAPVPVVEVDRTRGAAGAAANTAVNLAALGARVALVSVVGDDADAAVVRGLLDDHGVDTAGVVAAPGRPTAAKRRVLADDALVARFDTVATDPLAAPARRALDDALLAALEAGPAAVVVCDYACGALDDASVALLADRLGPPGPDRPRLVVDAHDPRRWAATHPDVVTPNAGEVAVILGRELGGPDRAAAAEAAAGELRTRCGASSVVVTLDRDGAVLLADGAPTHRTWARPAPESHTAGAGDTFTAALALALAAGTPAPTAVELAQAAADVVVARPGTSVCGTGELAERVAEGAEGSLLDVASLAAVVGEQRGAGRRVVFTNGCFDVVHRGHIASLNQAKRLGDVLVVALNSDDSVARLKGPDRPLTPLADRAAVIGALSCVDHVTAFDTDTPEPLLELLRPDVYAKGGDYTAQMLRETATVTGYGGRVVILDYLPDRSTTAIVERIRDGAR